MARRGGWTGGLLGAALRLRDRLSSAIEFTNLAATSSDGADPAETKQDSNLLVLVGEAGTTAQASRELLATKPTCRPYCVLAAVSIRLLTTISSLNSDHTSVRCIACRLVV
jgi:hypothetical protein